MSLPIGTTWRDAVRFSGAATSISALAYLNGSGSAMAQAVSLGTAVSQGTPAQTLQPFAFATTGRADGDEIMIEFVATVGGVTEKQYAWLACSTLVGSRSTLTAAAVWDYLTTAATTANSIGKRIVDYLGGGSKVAATIATNDMVDLPASRAAKIENADVATSTRATQTSVNSIASALAAMANQTDTSLAVPATIVVPTTSTRSHRIDAGTVDPDNGNVAIDMDSITLTAISATGTDRSSRLSSSVRDSVGRYHWIYTSTAGDAEEQLTFFVLGTVAGNGTWFNNAATQVVNMAIEQYTSVDRARDNAVKTRVDQIPTNPLLATDYVAPANGSIASILAKTNNLPASPASEGNVTAVGTAVATVGSALATLASKFVGITSLPNWLRSILRKSTPDVTALAEINGGGGTFNAATDSQEALAEAIAAVEGGGGGGNGNGDIAVDSNYGGVDNYRIVEPGTTDVGIDDVLITAFEFDAYPTINCQTRTGSDGHWVTPLMLDAGTYIIVASKPGKMVVPLGTGNPKVVVVS